MKCPRCGFNSFDYLDKCKRCGEPIEVNPRYRTFYQPAEDSKFKDEVKNPEDENCDIEYGDSPITPTDESIAVNEEVQKKDELESVELDVIYEVEQTENVEENLELAGFFPRFIAFILDSLIIFGTTLLVLIIGIIAGLEASDVGSNKFTNFIVPIFLSLLFLSSSYYAFLIGYAGKTIGMAILDLRVIEDDGSSIDPYRAFIRWIASFLSVSFLFIGYLWAIADPKSQTWHDKIAHTIVIAE